VRPHSDKQGSGVSGFILLLEKMKETADELDDYILHDMYINPGESIRSRQNLRKPGPTG